MRVMVKDGTKINVVEHIMTKNFWEYYITDEDTGSADRKFALVMGDYVELGDVSLSEIQSFIIARTKDMSEVFPAKGWKWEKEDT